MSAEMLFPIVFAEEAISAVTAEEVDLLLVHSVDMSGHVRLPLERSLTAALRITDVVGALERPVTRVAPQVHIVFAFVQERLPAVRALVLVLVFVNQFLVVGQRPIPFILLVAVGIRTDKWRAFGCHCRRR